jgi:hypothetical protein
MTYQQFVDQVIDLAASVNPNAVQDAEMVIESVLPVVIQDVAEKFAGDESRRQLLKQTFTLNVVSGAVNLDPSVLTSAMDDSRLYNPNAPNNIYSFMRNFASLSYQTDLRMGKYAIEYGDRLRVVPPGMLFVPSGGSTLTGLILNVAAIPAIPTSAGASFTSPDEFQSDLVDATAAKLVSISMDRKAA